VLVLNGVVGSTGTGLFLAGSMVFFVRGVGLSPYQIVAGLSVAGVCGLAAAVPTGLLADRIGPQRTLIALYLWRAVAYSLYLVVHDFPSFLLIVCATTVADKASPPISQALVGSVIDGHQRVRTMALVRAAQNVGLSVGAMLAAIALSTDTRFAYDVLALANGASYVVMAVLIRRLPRRDDAVEPIRRGRRQRRWPEAPFLVLTGLNGVLALHDTILFVGLPLWITEYTSAPRTVVSVTLVVNTVITALTQVWWTRAVDTPAGARRGMALSGGILASATLAISATTGLNATTTAIVLVAAAVLLTVGENLHSASSWALSFELAPAAARGSYLAVFSLGQSGRDLVGPALVTAAVVNLGWWGWLALAAVLALTGPAAGSAARRMQRRRLAESSAEAKAAPNALADV
jgi:MFS family permease